MTPPTTKRKNLKLLLWIALPLAILAFVITTPYFKSYMSQAVMTEQERYERLHPEAAMPNSSEQFEVDSVEVIGRKVAKTTFERDFSADYWFEDYSRNKVAFDKDYDGQKIDVYGKISEISTTDIDCAVVELKIAENPFCSISCNNCIMLNDKWSKEVIKLSVGDMVHIRGEYSGFVSSRSEMNLLKCHVIEDNP